MNHKHCLKKRWAKKLQGKLTHFCDPADVYRAWGTWREITGTTSWESFGRFIGTVIDFDHAQDSASHGFKASEQSYRKLQILLSPHARTLMHAFKARTGYQKKLL